MKNQFKEFKRLVVENISLERELVRDSGIYVSLINLENCQGMSDLYTAALYRGDWMATEYHSFDNFSPDREFFEDQIYKDNQIWFVFRNSNGQIIGSTKLGLCSNGSVIIDETQLHPKFGQGRNIMQNYFNRFLPLLKKNGFIYWTEFILNLGSRSLRKTLLTDLNMCVTGIRPSCYINRINNTPVSCLTAHAPSSTVTKKLEKFSKLNLPTEIKTFLELILGKDVRRISKKFHRTEKYKGKVVVPITNTLKLEYFIEAGYEIVAVDPFDSLVHLDVPESYLATQLWYLERERSAAVKRLVRFVLNNNMPLKKEYR